jgi:radical SAM protein with 4Fe4S-binding SPASM domain
MSNVLEATKPLLHQVMERAAHKLVPLQVSLELTYHCNLRCKHCYVDESLRRNGHGELTTQEWLDVLDQLVDMGTLFLLFTGGEVLTRPDFFDILSAAKERHFQVDVLTNCTLLDDGALTNFQELKLHSVGTSLYGSTAETHDAITRRPGSFALTTAAISRLAEHGLDVTAQATLMVDNIHEAEGIKGLAEGLGAHARLSYDLAPTKGCSLIPQEFGVTESMLDQYLAGGPLLNALELGIGPTVCQAGRGMCSISPVGDVFPCVMMPLKIGNIRDQPLRVFWKDHPSEELVYLRSLSTADLEGCAECPDAPFCYRCPGVALSETGSLTKRPPSACRNAAVRAHLYERKGRSQQ